LKGKESLEQNHVFFSPKSDTTVSLLEVEANKLLFSAGLEYSKKLN